MKAFTDKDYLSIQKEILILAIEQVWCKKSNERTGTIFREHLANFETLVPPMLHLGGQRQSH